MSCSRPRWCRQTRLRRDRLGDGRHQPRSTQGRALAAACAGRLRRHGHFMQKLESAPRIEFEDLPPAARPQTECFEDDP